MAPPLAIQPPKQKRLANWKYNADNLYESIKYTRFQNVAINIKEGEEAEPGDWVSNWALLTIKYKDGRGPVNLWVNTVYKIENGKIVMSRTAYDEADVLRQLNYQILPRNSSPTITGAKAFLFGESMSFQLSSTLNGTHKGVTQQKLNSAACARKTQMIRP